MNFMLQKKIFSRILGFAFFFPKTLPLFKKNQKRRLCKVYDIEAMGYIPDVRERDNDVRLVGGQCTAKQIFGSHGPNKDASATPIKYRMASISNCLKLLNNV